MQGTSRSELAAQLDRCARLCEEATSTYVARDDERDREVVSALLLAAAALETASGAVEEQASSAPTALLSVSSNPNRAVRCAGPAPAAWR